MVQVPAGSAAGHDESEQRHALHQVHPEHRSGQDKAGLWIRIRIGSGFNRVSGFQVWNPPDPYWIRIRIGIQPKMLDLDSDEMNAVPQPWAKAHGPNICKDSKP